MIAGAAILLCLVLIDIIQAEKTRRKTGTELGIVPLGIPLIAGPAVLTTLIIIVIVYMIVVPGVYSL